MSHDELQESLACHLRASTDRMVWTNTQLGPAGSPRPDVFTVNKSFARFRADCYEIKVSVSDLRHDVTSGKWQSYRKFGHAVWFAFPRGMVSLDLIPKECGVILLGETWRAARKPVAQVLDTLPRDAWIKLLMSEPEESKVKLRETNDWHVRAALGKKMGAEAVALFDARNAARHQYEQATVKLKTSAEQIAVEVETVRKQALSNVERQKFRINSAMDQLGAALGMKTDEINADSLTARIYEVSRVANTANISRTIEFLKTIQQATERKPAEAAA